MGFTGDFVCMFECVASSCVEDVVVCGTMWAHYWNDFDDFCAHMLFIYVQQFIIYLCHDCQYWNDFGT